MLMRFVRSLTNTLCYGKDALLAKGRPGRALYDTARCVCRVFRKGRALDLRSKDVWCFLGYGNLNTRVFYVLRLDECEFTVFGGPGTHQIILKAYLQPMHLWDLYEDLNLEKDYDLELWHLTASDAIVVRWMPVFFHLERPENSIVGKAWRSNPKIRLPLPPRPGPVAPVPIEDWRMGCGSDSDEKHELGEALDLAGRIVQRARRERAKRRRVASRDPKTPGPNNWEPQESSSESTNDSGHGGGGGGGGGPGERPPVIDPPPPVVAPDPVVAVPPILPPPDDVEWHRIDTPLALFVLDPYSGNIGCRCKHPLHTDHHLPCRINRMRTLQPVGYFLAWLLASDRFIGRQPHHGSRLWRNRVGDRASVVSYEDRLAGRAFAIANPVYHGLLEWEVPSGGAEPP